MQHLDNIPGIEARIGTLKARLKAREGRKEFVENCAEIRGEIDTLEERLFALKRAAGGVDGEPG